MRLKNWLFLVFAAFALYLIGYKLISKPLTDGEIERLVEKKVKLLKLTPSPRLIIMAGSNGRFSHSCMVLEELLYMRCVNASLVAGVGLDYILAKYNPYFEKGDIIYMPFEYEQYQVKDSVALSGPENALLWRNDWQTLRELGIKRILHATLFPDEKYFITGVLEMLLERKGMKRRFDEASLNELGDQVGHTEELGRAYQGMLKDLNVILPDITAASHPENSAILLGQFLRDAKSRGITVIGGLPTTFEGADISTESLTQLSSFYKANGQRFVVLENYSQYSPSCFFDAPYHLNSKCQVEHSRLIAEVLLPYMNSK
jgi:hypothetical protein